MNCCIVSDDYKYKTGIRLVIELLVQHMYNLSYRSAVQLPLFNNSINEYIINEYRTELGSTVQLPWREFIHAGLYCLCWCESTLSYFPSPPLLAPLPAVSIDRLTHWLTHKNNCVSYCDAAVDVADAVDCASMRVTSHASHTHTHTMTAPLPRSVCLSLPLSHVRCTLLIVCHFLYNVFSLFAA